ncbi:MAG: hypothetical protein VX871_02070, partial [Pseudomonadota bacterium]|nr:hypothetical protein [Pseudomonadota bacterium]
SYAIPGLFKPVHISGRWLMDGAFVNPVPVSVCRALGAEYVIAVNLHGDIYGRGTVVGGAESAAAFPALRPAGPAGTISIEPEAPAQEEPSHSIGRIMLGAFNITQDRIARARLSGEPPDVTIFPRLASVGLFDFHCAKESIAAGHRAACKRFEEIEMDLFDWTCARKPQSVRLAGISAGDSTT